MNKTTMRAPIWQQIVDAKDQWIGGDIEDYGDPMDRAMREEGTFPVKGKISDLEFRPNGDTAMYFSVDAEGGWGCGGSNTCLGVTGGDEGWLTFLGYGSHKWRIRKPTE